MLRFFVLISLALAAAVMRPVEWERPMEIPEGWTRVQHPEIDREELRTIHIGVRRQNTDALEEFFWAVSNPESERYAEYKTAEEMADFLRPSQESLDAVHEWLLSNGVTSWDTTMAEDYIVAKLPLSQLEEIFAIEFEEFVLEGEQRHHVSSLGPYFLPVEVHQHIDIVTGLVGFPLPRKETIPASPDVSVIGPANLRARYNISDVGSNKNNRQAVAEFQRQYYSPSDLADFFKQYVTYHPAETVAKVVGDNEGSDPGVEAELDIQYIMGVGVGIPTWFWSNPSQDFWSDLTAWVSQIENTTDAPWVHSVSYGSQGSYPSEQYRTRLDDDFKSLGGRGISIIFASGDSGTGCSVCYYFQPSFPATSQYVTSVGATTFLTGGTSGPEGAVNSFHSGGGMSPYFGIPDYQKDAVNHYFSTEKDLPEAHYYNRQGRGTPDVAALGIGFSVVVDGSTESVGGTSASAPTFSAVVSMLNDQQLNAGKKTLGFLNPWIYQSASKNSAAFFDVTVGDNQHGCCGYTGFKCSSGWDPVTGVGTPNYKVLKTLLP